MTIIDCHCHIYPTKIAEKAVAAVGDFYHIEMDVQEGSSDSLLSICKDSPITHHLVHSVATTPAQVRKINDFIASECALHPEFIGFATMHQDCENMEEEVEYAIELGLHGFKLHPDTQAVNMDDPRLMKLYELIEGRLPVMIHCGDYRYDYSHPRRLQNVLHTFPNLVVNGAHFGGWSVADMALEYLENENCFLDMSSSMAFLGPRRTTELIRLYGTDRIMFGSDFPMWNPIKELEIFSALDFTAAEFEAMTWHNAERYIGIDVQ